MNLPAFLGVSLLVITTPGQDTALIVRRTLAGGRRAGLLVALGVCTGQLLWTLAVGAGVAALLLAWQPAFLALRYLGAAYLIYLGAHALRDAIRGSGADPDAPGPGSAAAASAAAVQPAAAYRQGLISNLGNAKVAVFFTSLLPQFGSTFPAMLALGLIFAALTLVWLSFYAAAVDRLGGWLRRPAVRRALDAATGTVLGALGVRLATERA
ncbi:MAG TPA: LysE family translocator [Actinocrinis sp.]|nr:LysE family translocator [Actinocrinis sp.]